MHSQIHSVDGGSQSCNRHTVCYFHSVTEDGSIRKDTHGQTSVNKRDTFSTFVVVQSGVITSTCTTLLFLRLSHLALTSVREMKCMKQIFSKRPRIKVGRLVGAALASCRCFHAELVRTSWFITVYFTEHDKHNALH